MRLLEQNREGEWEYIDPAQLEMVFELELLTFGDPKSCQLKPLDVLLQSDSEWFGNEHIQQRMKEYRAELLGKFQRKYADNESIEDVLYLYLERFTRARMQITGKSLEIDRNTKAQEKRDASTKGGQAGFGTPKSALGRLVADALANGVRIPGMMTDGRFVMPRLWPLLVNWLQEHRADGDLFISGWPEGADDGNTKFELLRLLKINVHHKGEIKQVALEALWRQAEAQANRKQAR